MNYLKGILSSFAVKSPQAVKRALQTVTNFTRFLESCKYQFGKLKEAESFGLVEEGHYVQYSFVNARVYTCTSIHRAVFYILHIKGLE